MPSAWATSTSAPTVTASSRCCGRISHRAGGRITHLTRHRLILTDHTTSTRSRTIRSEAPTAALAGLACVLATANGADGGRAAWTATMSGRCVTSISAAEMRLLHRRRHHRLLHRRQHLLFHRRQHHLRHRRHHRHLLWMITRATVEWRPLADALTILPTTTCGRAPHGLATSAARADTA